MVSWFEVVYWLLVTEAVLRTVYFWQLKEYRLDRFREFLKSADAKRYFLPGRNFLRPKITARSLLIILLTLGLTRLFIWWRGYLLLPVTAALAVGLVAPLSDSVKWLAVAAAKLKLIIFHRDLVVVGITGSYGKTSTKEILAHILASKFPTAKTWDTNNTLIGVAKTVLTRLPLNTRVFVVEMGAYKIGEIGAICRLVKPQIGILTGINEQHLGLFGSLENIIKAKLELLQALPPDGLAIVNGVNPVTRKLRAPRAGTRYYFRSKFKTNLLGNHQQLNISAAAAAAKHLGVNKFDLTNVPHFKTAISKIKGINGATVINDSFSSNPAGFLAAVEMAKIIPAQKKILISPGIIDLGRESGAIHGRLLAAAKKVFDQIFITKLEAVGERELLLKLKQILTKNDLLLIEGRFSKKFIEALCSNRS